MNLFDRLFNKTAVLENGCWEFTGAKNNMGYGMVQVTDEDGRRVMLAHRLSYDLVVDDIPEGAKILHRCDNPACINPDHLYPGSMKDNSIDMATKERHSGILTCDKVREIKISIASGEATGVLATRYGVHKCTISAIKHGRNWKHVEIDQ